MKKALYASIAMASLAFLPVTHASPTAGNDAGFFIGAKAGQGYFNGDSDLHSNTYSVDLGYRWALGNRNNLGVELGYIKPQTLDYNTYYGVNSTQTKAYSLGVNYQVTFGGNNAGPHWFFAARLGYMHWSRDEKSADYNETYHRYSSYSDDDTGSYAGIGLGFDFNEHVGIGLYYDYYLARFSKNQYGDYSVDGLSVPSLGMEVRF